MQESRLAAQFLIPSNGSGVSTLANGSQFSGLESSTFNLEDVFPEMKGPEKFGVFGIRNNYNYMILISPSIFSRF